MTIGERITRPGVFKIIGFFLFILVLAGCSANKGPVNSYEIQEVFNSDLISKVNLVMGAGTLKISASNENKVTGIIKNNTSGWQPDIIRSGEELTVSQGNISQITKGPLSRVINDWTIQLSNKPTDLYVEANGYTGNINLTDSNIKTFRILESYSNSEIKFDTPNPVNMELFQIGSSGSTLNLIGLANANFDLMNFRGVGGNYTLDFSGELQNDSQINVIAGLGTIQIVIPKELAAVVIVTGNPSRFELKGPWTVDKNNYLNSVPGKHLNLDVKMDMGFLTLVLQ